MTVEQRSGRTADNMMNKNNWIDQQEDKPHELEQIPEIVKEWERESYNKFMNEFGQNSNDKKGKFKREKQN